MGDEDIASEDEQYITHYSSDEERASEDENIKNDDNKKDDEMVIKSKKRKKKPKDGKESHVDKKPKTTENSNTSTSKTTGKAKNLLIETGREIHKFDTEVQATFLSTCIKHFLNKPSSTSEINIRSDSFIPSVNDNNDHNMGYFLRQQYSSCKKLKNWKHNQSFKIIIVCISARRAVSILKQIGPLKISIAKLFPKHMSMSLQKEALEKNNYGIAIGTPNRLLKLWEDGAFHLKKTDFIVMDCWKDAKDFTVCTLKDTSPDFMKFIQDAVMPEMEKCKELKFAFH